MYKKTLTVFVILCLTTLTIYSQNKDEVKEPHKYGGWYCPDNLGGFPAVNIFDWEDVPVVNGRMPTQEETRNGMSLIFVDEKKYSDVVPLEMTMPRLATYYNNYSKRVEFVIVIQAFKIDKDSIVGFRYLNGGNGSSRFNEVNFLSNYEIDMIPSSRFISQSIKIQATQDVIWKILTKPEYAETFQPTFDKENNLDTDWRKASNVNYSYPNSGDQTSAYADKLFGSFYIQNDYNHNQYNEKFLLRENESTKETELIIVCGPFGDDYNTQQEIISHWAKQVKKISESHQTFSIVQ